MFSNKKVFPSDVFYRWFCMNYFPPNFPGKKYQVKNIHNSGYLRPISKRFSILGKLSREQRSNINFAIFQKIHMSDFRAIYAHRVL